MRSRTSALLAAWLVLAPIAWASDTAQREVRVLRFDGEVKIHSKDKSRKLKPRFGLRLAVGDRIVTGKKSWIEVSLGRKGIIRVEEKSEFVVRSLDTLKSKFKLSFGVLLMKAKKLIGKGGSFSVSTPKAVMAVRGTELALAHSKEDDVSRAGVFREGRIAMAWLDDPKACVEVAPNLETTVQAAPPTKPKRLTYFRGHWRAMRGLRKKVLRLHRQLRKIQKQKIRELREKTGMKKPFEEEKREKTLEEKREEMFLENLSECGK